MGDDYESLPDGAPWQHHMIAGSMAGILEHTCVFPIDSIKTRMMCLRPANEAKYNGLIDGFKKMFKGEGFKRSWRGVSSVLMGAGPAHAMYFSTYEYVKRTLSNSNYPLLKGSSYVLAGSAATIAHDSLMTPVDAIKQRMQVYNSPYKSCWQCLSSVLRSQGVLTLYKAYFTQLTMTIPHHAIHVSVYESLHDYVNVERKYKPEVHIVAGAIGGGVAAFITTPLDVCKTFLNTQTTALVAQYNSKCGINGTAGANSISGIWASSKAVYLLSGSNPKFFFRGALPRVLFTMPGAGISWTVYEFCKRFLISGDNTKWSTQVNSVKKCDSSVILTPSNPAFS